MLTYFSLQIVAYGISMAALTEKDHVSVIRGETTEFFILFWNPEPEPFPIRLKTTQVPEDFVVIVTPNDFMLNSSLVTGSPVERGRNYVNTKQGLMLTTPVKVLVKVPKTIEPGNYDLIVTATAGNPSEVVSTLLEKKFKFTVNVTSLTFSERLTQLGRQLASELNDIGKGITGMFAAADIDTRVALLASVVIGIFVVSFVVYKRKLR